MGSIVMTEIKVDNVVNVAGSGKPNFPVSPTHSSGSALSTLNTYQYDSTAKVVTVVSSGGNKYAIDGGDAAPVINLLRGVTYVFDQSASSNTNHPLRFKKADGSSFTVTASGTPGQSGATVKITVPTTGDMPASYYCTVHGAGMGNSVTTSVPKNGALVWDSVEARPMVYIANEFKNIQLNTAEAAAAAWWGARGMCVGGQTSAGQVNVLQYFTIANTGNATDFGDLTEVTQKGSSGSNGARGVRIGGNANSVTMDYWAFATTGNATDFGDTTRGRTRCTTVADGTKAITAGDGSSGYVNDIEYITVATAGNGTDFGDLTGTAAGMGGTNDLTRGVFAGDQGGTKADDSMEYITMSTPGNATDYGNLATSLNNTLVGVVGDNTYGVFMGGNPTYSNVIQYMTIQSSSNAQDFGDLAQGRAYGGATGDASTKRGMAVGGYVNPGSGGVRLNSIEYITVDSPGNATDFGDLLAGNENCNACSGAAS